MVCHSNRASDAAKKVGEPLTVEEERVHAVQERYPLLWKREWENQKAKLFNIIKRAAGECQKVIINENKRSATQKVTTLHETTSLEKMGLLLVSVIDFLCSTRCIIDIDDKPFGRDLPIEIQNRIMWMTRLDEHRDLMRNVHKELKSKESCRLTEWLHIPKRYPLFHEPFLIFKTHQVGHEARWDKPCDFFRSPLRAN